MAAGDLKTLIQVGFDILNTTVDSTTRKIQAQLGDITKQVVDSDKAEWWQHYGFYSRPPKPDPGKAAAQAIVLRAGDYDICLASQDLRGLNLYGSLDYGEVAICSAGEDGLGQARVFLKKDGSISAYTKRGNVDSGAGMLIQLDAQAGTASILNDQGFGLIADQNGVTLTAGSAAALTMTKDGNIRLIGTKNTQVDGSSIILGNTVAPGINSALTGLTGVGGKASVKTLIE